MSVPARPPRSWRAPDSFSASSAGDVLRRLPVNASRRRSNSSRAARIDRGGTQNTAANAFAGRGRPRRRHMLNSYSARRTFTGSSRKARYAGTRLAISATRASVAATAASVSGSDALTP